MTLMDNPQFKEFISQFGLLMQCTQTVSLEEARKLSTAFFAPPSRFLEPMHEVQDLFVPGSDGHQIPVRLYTPTETPDLPLFIYYHRGGWVFSNIEEADSICRKLAKHLECQVASVDFRLAPENPFPIPFNDCYDAFCFLADHAKEFGADPSKIIVGGESCGGNLAGAVTLKARDEKAHPIALQLLIYPIIQANIQEKAYLESADQYFLTKEAMHFFWSVYLQNPLDRQNGYASLDLASLEDLPPTVLITAEHDPLHVEGELYGKSLLKSGNEVVSKQFPGLIHGFLDLPIYQEEEIISWIYTIKSFVNYFLTKVPALAKN